MVGRLQPLPLGAEDAYAFDLDQLVDVGHAFMEGDAEGVLILCVHDMGLGVEPNRWGDFLPTTDMPSPGYQLRKSCPWRFSSH